MPLSRHHQNFVVVRRVCKGEIESGVLLNANYSVIGGLLGVRDGNAQSVFCRPRSSDTQAEPLHISTREQAYREAREVQGPML